ncbi:MAG: hypothetical protein AB1778_06410 [Candidatus Bipolaricaulota bacterium]
MEYSPILAVATALFEVTVAVWALRGPGDRAVLRTTSAILLLLAGYQIAEVAICTDVQAADFLPRVAFLIVTWLPPLGLVLIAQLHRPRSTALVAVGRSMLAIGAGIAVWILADRAFATASVCSAVYARYTHAMPRFLAYSLFYWVGLLAMVLLAGYGVLTCRDLHRRSLLGHVLAGTVAFLVPSIVTSWFVPAARGALPSIMCHFAVLLAVALARMVHVLRRPAEEAERRSQVAAA